MSKKRTRLSLYSVASKQSLISSMTSLALFSLIKGRLLVSSNENLSALSSCPCCGCGPRNPAKSLDPTLHGDCCVKAVDELPYVLSLVCLWAVCTEGMGVVSTTAQVIELDCAKRHLLSGLFAACAYLICLLSMPSSSSRRATSMLLLKSYHVHEYV